MLPDGVEGRGSVVHPEIDSRIPGGGENIPGVFDIKLLGRKAVVGLNQPDSPRAVGCAGTYLEIRSTVK